MVTEYINNCIGQQQSYNRSHQCKHTILEQHLRHNLSLRRSVGTAHTYLHHATACARRYHSAQVQRRYKEYRDNNIEINSYCIPYALILVQIECLVPMVSHLQSISAFAISMLLVVALEQLFNLFAQSLSLAL